MSLLTVKLEDIHFIDCGKYTIRFSTKRLPRYKPFLLQQDSFLLGKHEVCLTNKEISGGMWGSVKKWKLGGEKFVGEILGPVLDPWKREELLKQVLNMEEGDENKIALSLVRENFDEVNFSNIIDLQLRRLSFWSHLRIIDIVSQDKTISFVVCGITPFVGVGPDNKKTQKIFAIIQNEVKTYRR
jgi:hypothetical protein